jgi:hypothetical protein
VQPCGDVYLLERLLVLIEKVSLMDACLGGGHHPYVFKGGFSRVILPPVAGQDFQVAELTEVVCRFGIDRRYNLADEQQAAFGGPVPWIDGITFLPMKDMQTSTRLLAAASLRFLGSLLALCPSLRAQTLGVVAVAIHRFDVSSDLLHAILYTRAQATAWTHTAHTAVPDGLLKERRCEAEDRAGEPTAEAGGSLGRPWTVGWSRLPSGPHEWRDPP